MAYLRCMSSVPSTFAAVCQPAIQRHAAPTRSGGGEGRRVQGRRCGSSYWPDKFASREKVPKSTRTNGRPSRRHANKSIWLHGKRFDRSDRPSHGFHRAEIAAVRLLPFVSALFPGWILVGSLFRRSAGNPACESGMREAAVLDAFQPSQMYCPSCVRPRRRSQQQFLHDVLLRDTCEIRQPSRSGRAP